MAEDTGKTIDEIQEESNLGAIQESDVLLASRAGISGAITFNGVLLDADFTVNGYIVRTGAGTYSNRTITGVTNRTTITNGSGVSGNTVIDIASTYVGQNTITTLGTITTGTWNGATLNVQYGGNGRTSATAYAPICGGTTSTGAHQSAGTGTVGQVFVSQGSSTLPTWGTIASGVGIKITNTISSITFTSRTNIGTPQDYGAVGNGIDDDTTAFQLCLDNHDHVYIPSGTYKITSSLTITKRKTIQGSGYTSMLDFQNMAGANGIVLNYANPGAFANVTYRYSDFGIKSSDNSIGHGIYIDVSVAIYQYINRAQFDNLYINVAGTGNYAFYLYNPTYDNGFFCSKISNCWFDGGMYLNRLGDSVTIENNTVTGAGHGIYIPTFTATAANSIIRENNITVDGISILVGQNAINVSVIGNQIEHSLGSENYAVLFSGASGAEGYNNTFAGNNLNGFSNINAALVLSSYQYNFQFQKNFLTSNISTPALQITVNSVDNCISSQNNLNGLAILDSGTTTKYDLAAPATVQGDILYISGANTLAKLAKNTSATRYLSNTGSSNNPAWSQIDLSNGVTGFLNGITDASSAAAGKIGEVISNTVLIGSAVSLTSGVAADICSISLTAGDWDVWGTVATNPAGATTTSVFSGWVHTVSATSPTTPNAGAKFIYQSAVGAGGAVCLPTGAKQINVNSTTTVYLSTTTVFASSTMSAYGYIMARRRR